MADAQALQREVEDLLQFIYLMPVAVLRLDARGHVAMLNPKAVQLLQDLDIDSGQADGLHIIDALCPGLAEAWRTSAGRPGPVMAPQRCSLKRWQRSPAHLLLQLVRIDEDCSMLTIEDITSTVEQEREVSRQRRRLALALEQIRGYGVVMLDGAGTVIEWNPSIGRLFGMAEGAVQGQRLLDWAVADHADADADVGTDAGTATAPLDFETMARVVARDGWCQQQASWRRADGTRLWGDCIITPLVETDGCTSGYVAVVRDITAEHEREQQLLEEALTDPLTGLCNRRGLQKHGELLQAQGGQGKAWPGWIMVDIDHFKHVNDTHGHDGGDAVLKAVAADLRSAARDTAVVARLGGEEFVVLLPAVTAEVAARVAERLRARVQALQVSTGGVTVQVTASFGVALQTPEESWTAALQRADTALYAAKREGRNRVVLADGA